MGEGSFVSSSTEQKFKTYKKVPDIRRHDAYKQLILLISGILATGHDPVTLPRDKVVKEAAPAPQSTRHPFPLREHTRCRRMFTLLYTGVITERSKMSSITSVKTFQRDRASF